MNEAEAKTKWCPFARTGVYAGTGGIAVNRHCTDGDKEPLIRDETRCIGSGCMAWRGKEEKERIQFERMGEKPKGEGWNCVLEDKGRENFVIKSIWERGKEMVGYCGLAGELPR